jgi:hypothetical protein
MNLSNKFVLCCTASSLVCAHVTDYREILLSQTRRSSRAISRSRGDGEKGDLFHWAERASVLRLHAGRLEALKLAPPRLTLQRGTAERLHWATHRPVTVQCRRTRPHRRAQQSRWRRIPRSGDRRARSRARCTPLSARDTRRKDGNGCWRRHVTPSMERRMRRIRQRRDYIRSSLADYSRRCDRYPEAHVNFCCNFVFFWLETRAPHHGFFSIRGSPAAKPVLNDDSTFRFFRKASSSLFSAWNTSCSDGSTEREPSHSARLSTLNIASFCQYGP